MLAALNSEQYLTRREVMTGRKKINLLSLKHVFILCFMIQQLSIRYLTNQRAWQ